MDDKEVAKILVVTQNPRARDATKRTLDRTGDYETRAKMSSDLAQAINDGLLYYEKVNLILAKKLQILPSVYLLCVCLSISLLGKISGLWSYVFRVYGLMSFRV